MKYDVRPARQKPKRSSIASARKKDPRLRKGYREVQLELSFHVSTSLES